VLAGAVQGSTAFEGLEDEPEGRDPHSLSRFRNVTATWATPLLHVGPPPPSLLHVQPFRIRPSRGEGRGRSHSHDASLSGFKLLSMASSHRGVDLSLGSYSLKLVAALGSPVVALHTNDQDVLRRPFRGSWYVQTQDRERTTFSAACPSHPHLIWHEIRSGRPVLVAQDPPPSQPAHSIPAPSESWPQNMCPPLVFPPRGAPPRGCSPPLDRQGTKANVYREGCVGRVLALMRGCRPWNLLCP
jgi:hypothetical protein